MKNTSRERLEFYTEKLAKRGGSLQIDADTHIADPDVPAFAERPSTLSHADDYFHGKGISAEQLIARLDAAVIDMALVWQNPALTRYTDDPKANWEALRHANDYVSRAAANHPHRLLPAGWTDPKALGPAAACELARYCVEELGFPIVKMNPAQNQFPIDGDDVRRVLEEIVTLGATPAFHFGADTEFTPAGGLASVARRIHPHPVIAVHMGGGGAGYVEAEALYHESRRIGLELDNIIFVLSAKRETHMESDFVAYEAAGAPFNRNLCCASDAPYGLPEWCFAGFRALLASLSVQTGPNGDARLSLPVSFGSETAARYLGGNFAGHYLTACKGVLRAAGHSPAR